MKNSKDFIILESGNKQIICKLGDKILVDLLPHKEGEIIKIKRLFNQLNVVNDSVECQVLEARKLGEKVRIFKKRRRKGYEKQAGFRKKYTQLLVGGQNGNA